MQNSALHRSPRRPRTQDAISTLAAKARHVLAPSTTTLAHIAAIGLSNGWRDAAFDRSHWAYVLKSGTGVGGDHAQLWVSRTWDRRSGDIGPSAKKYLTKRFASVGCDAFTNPVYAAQFPCGNAGDCGKPANVVCHVDLEDEYASLTLYALCRHCGTISPIERRTGPQEEIRECLFPPANENTRLMAG